MTNHATHDAPQIVKHWTESEPVRLAGHRAGRVYLAGPMTGLPEFNFPAFNAEAAILRAQGLTVINPAEHGIVEGAEWADYLRHDIAGLASCERIHLLRGWENSKGARLEVHIAQQLGMVITRQEGATLQAQPAEVSDEPELASKVVNDSCWNFVEAMPHHLPGPIWNDLKPAIYAVLIHYHRAILALRPQSEPVGFINKPIVWESRQSEMIVKITSKAQPAYGFTHPIYAESPRPQAVPMTDERLAEVLTTAYGSPEWTMDDVRAARSVEAAALGITALERALTQRPAAQTEREAFEARVVAEAGEGAIAKWLGTDGYENTRVQDYRLGWVWCLEWQARASLPTQPAAQATPEPCPTCDSLRKDFARECVDTDTLLRLLGFVPEEVRTDGGSLNLMRLASLIEARKATPEPRLFIGACITDGRLHATVQRLESNGHVTLVAMAEMDAASLHGRDCVAQMTPATPEPVGGHDMAVMSERGAKAWAGVDPQDLRAGPTPEPVLPFLVRDVAALLGASVPDVCKALAHLGHGQRSTNMEIKPEEALAVAEHIRAAAVTPEPVGAREALERIASWNEHPAMLGVDYGSNGVRDYYRKIARDALAAAQANGGVQ